MTDATIPGSLRVSGERPDRNLALELVRVTDKVPTLSASPSIS